MSEETLESSHQMGSQKRVLRPLGEILLARGQMRKYQLDFLLTLQKAYHQKQRKPRLGDLLVQHRVLTENSLQEALQVQSEGPLESVTEVIARYDSEIQLSHLTRWVPAAEGL